MLRPDGCFTVIILVGEQDRTQTRHNTHSLDEKHILGNIIRCSHAHAESLLLLLASQELANMAALAAERHAHGRPPPLCVSAGLFGGALIVLFVPAPIGGPLLIWQHIERG
jgi:hypothetical protein